MCASREYLYMCGVDRLSRGQGVGRKDAQEANPAAREASDDTSYKSQALQIIE